MPPTIVELLPLDAADELSVTLSPAIDLHSVATTRLGAVGGREVLASTERGSDAMRTVLFERVSPGASLQPLLEVVLPHGLFGGGSAELVTTPQRTFLVVRVDVPGTGSFNQDVVLHWNAGRWEQLDPNAWLSEFTLPPCFEIWKGRRADLKALRGVSAVWVAGDANCCPSGGEVSAELEVRGRALRVRMQGSKLTDLETFRKDPGHADAIKACEAGKAP